MTNLFRIFLYILIALTVFQVPHTGVQVLLANKESDDEKEAIRRMVKQLEDDQKRREEEAADRWEAANTPQSSDDNSGCCACAVVIVIAIVVALVSGGTSSNKKNTISKLRQSPTSLKGSTKAANEVSALIDSKECPFCAERIRKNAKICRYCNRDLP